MCSLIITKYTAIEAVSRRLPYLTIAAILICIALAAYLANLSLTEKQAAFGSFYALLTRLASVALLSIYIIIIEHRALEIHNASVWLSMPISRLRYLAEKLLAYLLIIFSVCLLLMLLALPLTDYPVITLTWSFSLFLELGMVCTAAIMLTTIFKHPMISLMVMALLYLFARSAAGFYQHSDNIILGTAVFSEKCVAWLLKYITYLTPKLDQFAAAGWFLHYESFDPQWLSMLLQTVIYCALFFMIAVNRLYAKNL